MESFRGFLVILLAIIAFTEASNPPAKSVFPDLLAPFRGIFKSRQPKFYASLPKSEPLKDAHESETIKSPAHGGNPMETKGFRPYFPSEHGKPTTGESSSTGRPSPYASGAISYYRSHPQASNRVPRQEQSSEHQGFGYQPQAFRIEDQPGSSDQGGGGPGGFSDFGFGSSEFGGQSFEQPHLHHGFGHSRPPRRPNVPETVFTEANSAENQGFVPESHGSHSHMPSHRRRPFTVPLPHEFETQSSGYYPSTSFQDQRPNDPRGERETPIITLDDLKSNAGRGNQHYFDPIYRQPAPHRPFGSGSGPGSSQAPTRHIPTFKEFPVSKSVFPEESDQSKQFYEAQSFGPPGAGRFRHNNNDYNVNVVKDVIYQETKPRKQFALRPMKPGAPGQRPLKIRPTSVPTSEPDIHYGRPMLTNAASTFPDVAVSKIRPYKKLSDKPVLLSSPKIPNYTKSSSISNPVIQPYEPFAAASGYSQDESGGDFGGIQSNGDRILYHVAGHEGPYSYRFGYDTGKGYNRLFRFEEKDGKGYVKGKYGFYDKYGKVNVVNYEAHPQNGFTAQRGH